LSNAIKYGGGAPISVTLASSNDHVMLEVRDRGIGIAPEDQRRIFDQFERAVSSHNYGGLGLGLYISQKIVAAHGGDITVESALGSGASFVVRLPRFARSVMVLSRPPAITPREVS
jgi:signal transduction histidine kinase